MSQKGTFLICFIKVLTWTVALAKETAVIVLYTVVLLSTCSILRLGY